MLLYFYTAFGESRQLVDQMKFMFVNWACCVLLVFGCFFSPPSAAGRLPDFAAVFEKSSPSVATLIVSKHVQVEKESDILPKESDQGDLRAFFEKHFSGTSQPSRFFGSAVVADPTGYLFTSAHLVQDALKIWVVFEGDKRYKARLTSQDVETDVALLKIEAENIPVLPFGVSSPPKVGEWVMAIGSPFGFEKSASQGIISGLNRKLSKKGSVQFIQTDVATNPGNSGGPLLNVEGEVIGIQSQIYTRSGSYQGISFAAPIKNALKLLAKSKRSARNTEVDTKP